MMVLLLAALSACGDSNNDPPKMKQKIVCGDSVDSEMFDQDGNVYTVRMPGKCDTLLVPEDQEK